jgi:hypothetical protein
MTRVRGMAPWQPRAKTLPLIENVREILDLYLEQLPLTIRQAELVAVVDSFFEGEVLARQRERSNVEHERLLREIEAKRNE